MLLENRFAKPSSTNKMLSFLIAMSQGDYSASDE